MNLTIRYSVNVPLPPASLPSLTTPPTSEKPLVLILSGSTAAGKNTVWWALHDLLHVAEHPLLLRRTVSCTTRSPRQRRPGDRRGAGMEEYGVDYHFISEPDFRERIEADHFAEWALVHGHRYGTPREELQSQQGESVILAEIEVDGTQTLTQFLSRVGVDHRTIFIQPPGTEDEIVEALQRSLALSASDTAEAQAIRLERVRRELRAGVAYHHRIPNDISKGDMGVTAARQLLLEVFDITL